MKILATISIIAMTLFVVIGNVLPMFTSCATIITVVVIGLGVVGIGSFCAIAIWFVWELS